MLKNQSVGLMAWNGVCKWYPPPPSMDSVTKFPQINRMRAEARCKFFKSLRLFAEF